MYVVPSTECRVNASPSLSIPKGVEPSVRPTIARTSQSAPRPVHSLAPSLTSLIRKCMYMYSRSTDLVDNVRVYADVHVQCALCTLKPVKVLQPGSCRFGCHIRLHDSPGRRGTCRVRGRQVQAWLPDVTGWQDVRYTSVHA